MPHVSGHYKGEAKMSAMDKLLAAVNQAKHGAAKTYDTEYFYYPARDDAGNGSAIIRFLPGKDDDEIPFVKVFSHGFQGPTGKWLIEDCPTTLGQECPICEANSEHYRTLTKDEARKHGMNRKTSFFTRILVVEDKKNPENEGKVFKYSFGTKIFEKICDALQPTFEDDKPIEVFDLKKGANFKLKIRKVDGQTNYDKSEFEAPSKCTAEIEYNDDNDIQKFIAPSKFKTPEQLKAKLDFVLGKSKEKDPDLKRREEEFDQVEKAIKPESKRVESPKQSDDNDDDDVLAMMRKLAEAD